MLVHVHGAKDTQDADESAMFTLDASFQLGEFLRFSEGEISERGRGIALDILGGELLLDRRKGCT